METRDDRFEKVRKFVPLNEREDGSAEENEHDFEIGDIVKVRRSTGEVEEGWEIFAFGNPQGELKAMLFKMENGQRLEKDVPLSVLKELNE